MVQISSVAFIARFTAPLSPRGGIECLAYFQLFSEGLGSEKNILGNAELVLPLGFILFYSAPPPFI